MTEFQCRDCIKYQRHDCPRCEYVNPQQNLAACVPTDAICNKFQAKLDTETPKSENISNVKQKKIVSYLPFIELPDGRLAEQAYDGKDVYFLVYDPNSENVTKMSYIELEDTIVKPIDNAEIRYNVVLQPSDIEEYGDEHTLFNHIREYLNRWHEAPDTLSRTLDVLYCFLTYIADLIPQLPYRRYLAAWGKGKSAWLETLGWICYRPIILAGSDTDKSVVRKLDKWRGTAVIDEADFGDSTYYAFLVKILNIGYDHKTGYYNRCDDNDPTKTLTYNVYGPKLLATRSKYKDLALESRCLTTYGRQNRGPIPLYHMEQFQHQAQCLRNQLILWRFRNYHRIKDTAKQLEDSLLADQVYNGAKGISSRVKQVILPLWLIGGAELQEKLTCLAENFDARLKIEDPDYLLELQAKTAVQTLYEQYEQRVDIDTVNITNMVNVLMENPHPLLEIRLSLISRTVLSQQGLSNEDVKRSHVTSMSKKLASLFDINLGFKVYPGKQHYRYVSFPLEWAHKDAQPPQRLMDFMVNGERQ